MRCIIVFTCLAILSFVPRPAFGAEPRREISVAVLDSYGRLIPNIPQSSFQVFADGVRQPIVAFRAGGPAILAILVELSGQTQQYSSAIVDAAARMVDNLSANDSVALASFGSRMVIYCDFTSDRALIRSALNVLNQSQISASEGSVLFDALAELENRMKTINEQRKAIVVFTTGLDISSKVNLEQARTAIRSGGVPIYALGLGVSPQDAARADETLRVLAADAAGQVFHPSSPEDDQLAFKTIRAALNEYRISYQPTGQGQSLGAANPTVQLVNAQTNQPLIIRNDKGSETRYQIVVTPIP
jgi:VWFA-related protein